MGLVEMNRFVPEKRLEVDGPTTALLQDHHGASSSPPSSSFGDYGSTRNEEVLQQLKSLSSSSCSSSSCSSSSSSSSCSSGAVERGVLRRPPGETGEPSSHEKAAAGESAAERAKIGGVLDFSNFAASQDDLLGHRDALEEALAADPLWSALASSSSSSSAAKSSWIEESLKEESTAKSLRDPRNPLVQIVTRLGCVYTRLPVKGHAAKQRDLQERALVLFETALGPESPEVARTLLRLATAEGQLGAEERQKELLERARRLFETAPNGGPESVAVARTLVGLGEVHRAKRQELLERAFRIFEANSEKEEEETEETCTELAGSLVSLATYFLTLEEIASAEEIHAESKNACTRRARSLLVRALRVYERNFGPDSVEVAETLGLVARTYRELGDAVKMRGLLERALRIQETTFGPVSLEVGETLLSLAKAHKRLGNVEKQKEVRSVQNLESFLLP